MHTKVQGETDIVQARSGVRRGPEGSTEQGGLICLHPATHFQPIPAPSHRKQAPPLLSGNSSLASSGSKCLRERTRAGRGAHREDHRAEMHRRGAAHQHACGRLRAAPGRDAREGPEAGQLATLAFLLGGGTPTPSSRNHRPGVNKRWKEGQPLRPCPRPLAHHSRCPQGTGKRTHL